MISVRRIQIDEGELFKRMRLTALCESPFAFASTYETALRRSPESWSEQANSTAQGSERCTFRSMVLSLRVRLHSTAPIILVFS